MVLVVRVISAAGDALVVNADGSLNINGGGSEAASPIRYPRPVRIVSSDGNALKINPDGSVNAST
jgi:hypothetical protein